ncbi:MAG: hypothetical protein ACRC5H_01675 [Treponemataceae bacterium]
MEKSTTINRSLRFGLLILVCAYLPIHIHAQEYVFTPNKVYVTLDEKITFVLLIPKATANQIDFKIANLPENVTFFSSQKKTVTHNNSNAVLLELDFVFAMQGLYTLPPVTIKVGRNRIKAFFDEVMVFEKKENMIARGFWTVDSENLFAKEPISLSLNTLYVKKILSIKYDLPDDSFFTLINDLQIDFSDMKHIYYESISIATFEWTPFVVKTYHIPSVKLSIIDVHNNTSEIVIPEIEVAIEQSLTTKKKTVQSKTLFFENAFINTEETSQSVEINDEHIVEDLARFRTLEREKIPFFLYQKERKEYEQKKGIIYNENEFPRIIFIITSMVTGILIFIVLLCFLLQKKISILILLLFFAGILLGIESITMMRKYALVEQGIIYAIPNDASSTVEQIPVGTRITIKKIIGEWAYMHFHKTEKGWIKTENLYFY